MGKKFYRVGVLPVELLANQVSMVSSDRDN